MKFKFHRRFSISNQLIHGFLDIFEICVLIVVISLIKSSDSSGWMKICGEKDSFMIDAGECPKGISLPSPLTANCVCVHGIWRLSKGECDPQPVLLVGYGGQCFNLKGAQIDTINYVGRPSTPFAPSIYIGSEWLNSFWKLPSGSKTSRDIIDLPNMAIVNIFTSQKVISAKNTACCYMDGKDADNTAVQICMGAPSGDYLVRNRCHYSNKALTPLKKIKLDFGQGMQFGGGELLKEAADECKSCAKQGAITFNTGCCKALLWEDDEDFALVDEKRYDKQTNRIVGAHLDFMLHSKRNVFPLDTYEFNQLRWASGVLGKVCPQNEVPPELLKFVLRSFKQVLVESLKDFPMERTLDSIQSDRIMEGLQQCYQNAQGPWQIEQVGTCTDPAYSMDVNGNKTVASMPDFQKMDIDRFDLVMETVWKMIQFAYYYCAPYFEKEPTDASYLLNGLEKLFNTDLTRRWTHPGNGFKVFKFLLPTFDLGKFAGMLDACVLFAKSTCITKKQWLYRPFLRERKVNKRSMNIWNGTAVCLSSYFHPRSSYENACGSAKENFYSG